MATDRAELTRGASAVLKEQAAKPLAVCHIDSGDLWAGAEVNTTALLRALARNPGLRLSAILMNEGEMSRRLRGYGIEVKVIPESSHGFAGIFRESARYLRSHPAQILHSHRYKENLLAALLARRCGVPHLVCTRHGAPEPFRGWRGIKHSAIACLDRVVMRYSAERVVSLTEEMRNQLVRQFPAERVVTIPTGIDTEEVYSELTQGEAKRRLGIPPQAKVVGYAGRLAPVKRLDIFLRTAKQMAIADSEVRFVIAGAGPEEERLLALTRELDLEDKVQFLGYRPRVYEVMRAFDLFVLCSDHEGLPRSVLEALFLGVPVVARRVGGIQEVIEDGVTGVLMDSGEPGGLARACLELLLAERQRDRLRLAGLRLVREKFSVNGSAREISGLYRGMADGECGRQKLPTSACWRSALSRESMADQLAERARPGDNVAMMRVGFAVDIDYPHLGEVRPTRIGQSLHRLGHRVVYACPNSGIGPQVEEIPYGRVYRFGWFGGRKLPRWLSAPLPFNPLWAFWIKAMARKEHLDVLISSNLRLALPMIAASRWLGVPAVVDLQENNREAVRLYPKTKFRHYVMRNSHLIGFLENLSVRLADQTWVVVEERLAGLPEKPRARGRVSVVCHTPSLEDWPAEQGCGAGPGRDGFNLIYLGLFAPGVGSVERIVEALPRVLASDQSVRLILGGGGDHLVPRLRELGIEGHVRLDGIIPPERIPAWLRQGDVGIIAYPVNSCTNTTISNKIFHYMAAGLPILSSDMAPTRRILEEVGCGICIPEASTDEDVAGLILRLRNSATEREQMGRRGRRAVEEKYNWAFDFDTALGCLVRLVSERNVARRLASSKTSHQVKNHGG